MAADVIGPIAQFGSAGLIAMMWIAERRSAAEREVQLRETHDRLGRAQMEIRELVEVVRRNTRAMVSLRGGNRELAMAIDRAVSRGGAHLGAEHVPGHPEASTFDRDEDDDMLGA